MKAINKIRLRELVFLALCCDLGLFSKKLINPLANLITDFLRIPGGIGTSFSLMFLVIAVELVRCRHSGLLMGFIQSMIAWSIGMVGSMGALAPIGYMVPGIVIDLVLEWGRRTGMDRHVRMILANMLSAVSAALTANFIVFGLRGIPLALYLSVGLLSGALFGEIAYRVARRLVPIIQTDWKNQQALLSGENK